MPEQPELNHPSLAVIQNAFPEVALHASNFRGMTTLVVPLERLHDIARHLHDAPECDYDFLSDVVGVDYLDFPTPQPGRFAVCLLLSSGTHNNRLTVKVFLDPSIDTSGIEFDPALEVDSVTDIWPGAEWPEREVYDMFGIRFRNHPDLRRILTWRDFPAHPLRKDYPVRGRGEREHFKQVSRDST